MNEISSNGRSLASILREALVSSGTAETLEIESLEDAGRELTSIVERLAGADLPPFPDAETAARWISGLARPNATATGLQIYAIAGIVAVLIEGRDRTDP